MTDPIKIALIGSAPSSIHQAPYGDQTWQVWGCSPGAYGSVPRGRSNIWFEMHKYEPGQTWFSPEYCQFLRDHPCVVVGEMRKEIPNGIELDWAGMIRRYSDLFFTSSLAWMMAHAIDVIQAAGSPPGSRIGLWGVDMAANEEYEAQRAGCHYFSIIARQAGIEVGTPPTSDLFRPRFLYGLDEHTHAFLKLRARKTELEARLGAAQQAQQQKMHEVAFLQGALDDLNYMYQTWPDKTDRLGPPEVGAQILVPFLQETKPADMSKPIQYHTDGNGSVWVTEVTPSAPPKRRRKSKANGADAPAPTIAAARLGPGRLVGV